MRRERARVQPGPGSSVLSVAATAHAGAIRWQPPKTTLGEAESFGSFMLKAVLDGRGTELMDLAKVNLLR